MELVSRIKAVLRRSGAAKKKAEDIIVSGSLEINTKKHEVKADGEVVGLTLKEYELLKRQISGTNRGSCG